MSPGQVVAAFFQALQILVLISVLGSWVPSLRRAGWYRSIDRIVDPMLAPFRRILPPENLGGLDISPIFLLLALGFVQNLIFRYLLS